MRLPLVDVLSILCSRRGRALPVVLGFLAVFGVSAVLGFYVFGPMMVGGKDTPSEEAEVAADAVPEIEADDMRAPTRRTSSASSSKPAPNIQVDITEGDDAGSTASRKPSSTQQPDKPSSTEARPQESSDAPASPRETKKPEPEPAKPEPEKPAPTKPAPGQPAASEPAGKLYRVQVGVYSDEGTAKKIAEQVRAQGQAASVVKGVLNGRDAWRVQAGAFQNKTSADNVASKLKGAGLEAMVLATD